ncbi:hypothetical protein CMI45_02225 [Candidatus Pacearchaeota archaeon]|jgi:RNase P/RNase MRP subunit p30|nr:hypothetical protein [Candidatus Pacearchaeota archaeon]|tara:strand:- start:1517 stop:1903 length:387 start_codon:yes stop_codon:yes gene_type:complete
MITEPNASKAKQLIKNSKSENIEILSQDHAFNRAVIEYGKFSTIIFPNTKIKTRRTLRMIDSGLDRVSAKAAAKNKITISYDISALRNLSKKEKAIEMEKFLRIIKLVRKHKAKFQFLNAKSNQPLSF